MSEAPITFELNSKKFLGWAGCLGCTGFSAERVNRREEETDGCGLGSLFKAAESTQGRTLRMLVLRMGAAVCGNCYPTVL